MKDIFINKKTWQTFTEAEMNEYIQKVFNYYRKNGFPYFNSDKIFRDREFLKTKKYDFKNVIDKENKTIKQTMHGLSLAWSYMPHIWEIICGNKKTPFEVFHNDELTYDTPITDDVLRHQTDPDVDNILGQIKRL